MWIREGSLCFSNLHCLGQQRIFIPQSLQTSFIQGEEFRHIRSPTLKYSGAGSLGCLQMMTVTPVMSISSSIATVVSPGSPENTWLGHWARITLRMVSRRTARVKVEENRLDSRSQRRQDLGSSHHPQAAHLTKGHRISKTPQLTRCTIPPPPVSLRI